MLKQLQMRPSIQVAAEWLIGFIFFMVMLGYCGWMVGLPLMVLNRK